MLKKLYFYPFKTESVMKSLFSYIFLLTVLFTGCRTAKVTNTQGVADTSLRGKEILEKHQETFPAFETLAGTLTVTYSRVGKIGQAIPLSFRMKKGEAIWLSAPLGMAKALITKDKVQFYNKLDNTYFEGDYTISEKYLGVHLGFEALENLLLGQLLFRDRHTTLAPEGERYKGELNRDGLDLSFFLNAAFRMDNLFIVQEKQTERERSLYAAYTYQTVEGQLFPLSLLLQGSQGAEQVQLRLQFSALQRNVAVRFPYSVPSGYQPLTLRP
jgi:hypothetical protein